VKRIINYRVIAQLIIIVLLPVQFLTGNDKFTDEFIIGKIEFTTKAGREGIAVLGSPEKKYLLNKGVLLLVKRGSERIILKVNDADGKYLRCIVNDGSGTSVLREGEDVYYSDSINSSTKFRDAKRILVELIELYEEFILKIESTEDTLIISGAVNKFSGELDRLIPEMKRLNSKYPELRNFKAAPPSELKDEAAKLESLEPRLKDAFFKINMYRSDENIKKATETLQKVLTRLNTGQ